MNIPPPDEKMEKYLDELADEYKVLLFKALLTRSKSLDELSVSELLTIDNEIKKPLIKDNAKMERMRRKLLLLGILYVFVGVSLYLFYMILFTDVFFDSNPIELISLTLSVSGVFAAILSFMIPTIKLVSAKKDGRAPKELLVVLEYEIITKWRELEGLVNDISGVDNTLKPHSIIEFLSTGRLISANDRTTLRKFLKWRNSIVHDTNKEPNETEMRELLVEIDEIISNIKIFM